MNQNLIQDRLPAGNSQVNRCSSVSTSDPCQHAASLPDWSQDYLQLSAGAFSGEITEASIGTVQVFMESINQCVDEKANPRCNSYTVGIPIRVEPDGRWQGRGLQRDSLMTLRPNEELHFRTAHDSSIMVTVIDRGAFDEYAETTAHEDVLSLIVQSSAEPLQPDVAQRYRMILHQVLACAIDTPDVLRFQASRKAITEAVMHASLVALCARSEARERGGGGHAVQRAVVERARSYVMANREKAPTVADLSAHLKMSRRGLHHAFMNVLGINVTTFLRYVRLHGARKDLLRAGPADTVSAIACKWGFWHMGMFSSYYKGLFGETPSVTLRQPPRVVVRNPQSGSETALPTP